MLKTSFNNRFYVRVLLLNVFVYSLNICYSQPDSLKKYTYLVYCKTSTNHKLFGAGFFIKIPEGLFFLTANHLAAQTPCNKLNVVLDKKIGSHYSIDISKIPKQQHTSAFGEKDLLIYKIVDKKFSKVNSVEKLLPDFKNLEVNKIKNIVYYGFPEVDNESDFDFIKTFPTLVMSEDTLIGSYNYIRYSNTLSKYDSINYLSGSINGTFSGEGDSGAPVFFKIQNQYFFGGMCKAGVGSLKIAYIMRPEKILEEIKKIMK